MILGWLLFAGQLFFCLLTIVLLIEFMDRKTVGRLIAFLIFLMAAASSCYLSKGWPLVAGPLLVLILDMTYESPSRLRRFVS